MGYVVRLVLQKKKCRITPNCEDTDAPGGGGSLQQGDKLTNHAHTMPFIL